jgi:hypothetical protein
MGHMGLMGGVIPQRTVQTWDSSRLTANGKPLMANGEPLTWNRRMGGSESVVGVLVGNHGVDRG